MGTLKIVMRLAWRNLWRNYRRTLIMLTAITVGVWAMIFMTALMRGMVNEMVRDAVRVLPGHVQVHHPDYLDDPNVINAINAPADELLAILESDLVSAWTARVRVPAVISSARESRSVTLLGIDPKTESGISFVAGDMAEGRFLDSPSDEGVIIGRKLLENLETGLGKRVVVMSQDPDNEIADRGFRIVGVFNADTEALEEGYIFTGITAAQEFLGIGEQVHEVAISGQGFREAEVLAGRVTAASGDGLDVRPWQALNTYLGTMLGVMDGFVLIWFIVVFLALSFGLVNTLVMAVFERVREIGLMMALGMKPRVILSQIVIESVLLIFFGAMAGTVLAIATVYPLKGGIDLSVVAEGLEMFGYSTVLYPELIPGDVLMANIIVIVLGMLASLSPAFRASRYQPVEALTRN